MYHKIVEEDLTNIVSADLPWQQLEGKTILVSGANGLLPSYMVETLLFLNTHFPDRAKTKVIAMVRNPERAAKRFEHYLNHPDNSQRANLRILSHELQKPLLLDEPLDFIIHGASPASPRHYMKTPEDLYIANVLGTYNLLTAAQRHQCQQFLYISSGEVYGRLDKSQMPVKETSFGGIDPTRVRSCYSESKRIAENMCAVWHLQHGLSTKIVRPCHTFGPFLSLDDGRVFGDFIADIINGRSITLKSDGKALRTFCYLADATEAFFTVMLKGEPGEAYNVASKDCTTTIGELADMLSDSFGSQKVTRPPADQIQNTAPATEIWPDATPDPSKVMSLGWSPRTSLKECFARTLLSFDFKLPVTPS